jgi:hypothetical protein
VICHETDPDVGVYKDCVYVPANAGNFWTDKSWGVYASDGRIIDAAAFRNTPGKELCGQNETCLVDFGDAPYAPRACYFYVGNIINHYGHFICSSMSRLWAITGLNLTSIPLVGHAIGSPRDWFNWGPFVSTLFGSAGVVCSDFAEFQTPVRFRELIVAQPSFVEQSHTYKLHARAAHGWGDRLVKTQDLSAKLDAVYLSRGRLGWRRDDVCNEADLVEALEKLGVTIIYPEQFTISEQIGIFRRTKRIIGQVGSAFHTSFFSEQFPGQVFVNVVTSPTAYSPNHALMDLANSNRSLYVYLNGLWRDRDGGGKEFELSDPETAAHDLLELASSPVVLDTRKDTLEWETEFAGLENVAVGKTARQSSLSIWSEPGEANRAISGIFPGDFAFHTSLENCPFWELDLHECYMIEVIIIHNRVIQQGRASNLVVETSVDGEEWRLIHAGRSIFGTKNHGRPLILKHLKDALGRYIKISLNDYQYLHLSQVEVLAKVTH